MAPRKRAGRRASRDRRGAAAVLGLFLTTALIVLMAVSIDLGYVSVARGELRRSADAAAMAACWQLFDERVKGTGEHDLAQAITVAASNVAARNTICTESPLLSDEYSDVQLGYYNSETPALFDTSDPSKFNAVRVHLRRQDAVNGEVPLFFSQLLGRGSLGLQCSSTAAMSASIGGFRTPPSEDHNINLLPIALDRETWEETIAKNTSDDFCVVGGVVKKGGDGIYECNLYPQGTGSPGNRGTVDIGGRNNSTADLSRQILHGISRQDFIDLGKPLMFDDYGKLYLNGDTGISAGIKDELASIIGQKRLIPIFESVSGNGNNANYTIIRFEGVRILEVKLTGPMKQKRLVVQPAMTLARGAVVTNAATTNSHYAFAPVRLVQ
ncbi:TadG family pilus assembly protein [Candidatus Laterigemmans baculatus]|uniref:TadG family pilus assembly protein n=1 Tax=Candidatus Laterigemmans baculatus TaxID=2770505 RepID=UPI0036F25291